MSGARFQLRLRLPRASASSIKRLTSSRVGRRWLASLGYIEICVKPGWCDLVTTACDLLPRTDRRGHCLAFQGFEGAERQLLCLGNFRRAELGGMRVVAPASSK